MIALKRIQSLVYDALHFLHCIQPFQFAKGQSSGFRYGTCPPS